MFWCSFSQRAVWPGSLTAFKQDCAVEPLPAECSLLWWFARCRKSPLETKCQAKAVFVCQPWVVAEQQVGDARSTPKKQLRFSTCSLVCWFGLIALTLCNSHLSFVPGCLALMVFPEAMWGRVLPGPAAGHKYIFTGLCFMFYIWVPK